MAERTFLVGVVVPDFCDQAYLRDRDLKIHAQDESAAIQKFIEEYKGYWLRPEEFKFVRIIKEG